MINALLTDKCEVIMNRKLIVTSRTDSGILSRPIWGETRRGKVHYVLIHFDSEASRSFLRYAQDSSLTLLSQNTKGCHELYRQAIAFIPI